MNLNYTMKNFQKKRRGTLLASLGWLLISVAIALAVYVVFLSKFIGPFFENGNTQRSMLMVALLTALIYININKLRYLDCCGECGDVLDYDHHGYKQKYWHCHGCGNCNYPHKAASDE